MLSTNTVDQGQTAIDFHPKAALICLALGALITFFYYAGFSDFRSSMLPWKISAALTITSAIVLLIHYALNRHSKRLIWEGFAALFGLLPMWLLLGSCWLFYFMFAPMPYWARWVALVPGALGTACWLRLVWKDFERDTRNLRLADRLYKVNDLRILYSSESGDTLVALLRQRNPFSRLHFLVIPFGPLLGATALGFIEHFQSSNGPHAVFLIASFLTFPVSQWMLAYLGLRTVYFHIYLPLRLERENGKKVILAP